MKAKSATFKYEKGQEKHTGGNGYLLWTLLILLFYPPFFRGLFFQKELIPTQIFTGIFFLICFFMTKNAESHKKYSWTEIGFLALVTTYILSTVTAVNKNLSIQETLKYIDYFCILYLSKRLIDRKDKLRIALTTLVVSGVIVVLIGTGVALEAFQYHGAFVDGMMNSTFQYHNTFGTYCLAILFLAYMLLSEYEGKVKYLIGVSTFLLFFGFILSYSRGAWVLLPVVGFVYYLLVAKEHKITFMSQLVGNLLGLILIIKPFTVAIEGTSKSIGWLWLILGTAVSVLVGTFIEKGLYKINLKEKIYNFIIPIIAIIIPAIGLFFKNTILSFLPPDLAQRLGSISLGTDTVTERTVFYKDALKIVKEHPVFGTGGGGWSTLYRGYQTYGYSSTQAHNYFMQLWIEIGTVGIAIFACILLAYLVYSIKTYRKFEDTSSKGMYVAMFTAVATILIHSIIDFDLTLSAMAIVMWSMIGMQLGMDDESLKVSGKIGSKLSYITLGITAIFLFVSSTNYLAANSAMKGIQYFQANDVQKGQGQFKKASMLSPFDPTYIADYGNITNQIAHQINNNEELKESIHMMDQAVEIGQYDFKLLTKAMGFYYRNREMEKGLEMVKKLEQFHPLNSATYENKTSFLLALANYYIENKNEKEALPLLKEVVEVENKVNGLNEEIKSKVEMNSMVRFVKVTEKTRANIGKGKEMLEGLEK